MTLDKYSVCSFEQNVSVVLDIGLPLFEIFIYSGITQGEMLSFILGWREYPFTS